MMREEASGAVIVGAARGLNVLRARELSDAALRFGCVVEIGNARGVTANARELMGLLLLGARTGDVVHVHCAGPGAGLAYQLVSTVLERA